MTYTTDATSFNHFNVIPNNGVLFIGLKKKILLLWGGELVCSVYLANYYKFSNHASKKVSMCRYFLKSACFGKLSIEWGSRNSPLMIACEWKKNGWLNNYLLLVFKLSSVHCFNGLNIISEISKKRSKIFGIECERKMYVILKDFP